jgi:hypothetical protein
MQLRPLSRAAPAAPNDGNLPLEVRLHHLHRRRRRAFMRRFIGTACWGAAILGATGFALAMTLGLGQR